VAAAAESLYAELRAQKIEVLYDDRDESPGVKFNDADLLGIPLRVTVSPRTLGKNSAELKRRSEEETELVPVGEAVRKLRGLIQTSF
jgi:prolyl-tRNA synthetase